MWPFAGMSLAAATAVGSIANWSLLLCLLGGVVATFVIVQTTDVKEEHWAEDRRHSNERVAELSATAEQLRKDTAEANARAAEARAKTAEAEERLGRLSMSRALFLDSTEFKKVFNRRPDKMKVQISWLRSAADSEFLARRIASCLSEKDGMPFLGMVDDMQPIEAMPDGAGTGVTVVGKITKGSMVGDPETPADFVMRALSAGLRGDPSGVSFRPDFAIPEDIVKIIIGPKL